MSKMIKGKVDAVKYVQENGFPTVECFEDKKGLQKFYKQLDDATLETWCAEIGVTFTPCPENPPIHRMRVAMAILYKMFPRESKGKKKAKYADYSTEDLIQLAIDKEVPVEPTDDMRIMRMRVIMNLRAAGHIE